MASIEDRDEYAKQEEAGLEKQAMDLKEEDVRISHPSFSFVSSSSPSQHRFINQPYFGGLSSIYDRSEGASSSGAGEAARGEEREHMFDKVVTPSDVGKLNRLVIPKQHAEKYFPLDSAANGKGLLLNFEDRSGKPWRFRYSYWNSSQSYVMTKGWSRFVKEKKLDAGDIVSFERCKAEGIDRFFIDWRRKPNVADPSLHGLPVHHRSMPWGRLLFPPIPRSHLHFNYGTYHYNVMNPASFNCLRPPGWPMIGGGVQYAGSIAESSPMVFDSVPLVQGAPATSGKRVRLFGVNLDCPTGEEADSHGDNPAAKSVFQPSPPSQLRPYGGGPAISRELQRKPKTSLSLDLDI